MQKLCTFFTYWLVGWLGGRPVWPVSLKVKNVHNFGIFQLIRLKLGMFSHVYLICKDFSMLTSLLAYHPKSEKCA